MKKISYEEFVKMDRKGLTTMGGPIGEGHTSEWEETTWSERFPDPTKELEYLVEYMFPKVKVYRPGKAQYPRVIGSWWGLYRRR